jgi:ABC-type glycerol-3-phosphate transport system substrate-binding protein
MMRRAALAVLLACLVAAGCAAPAYAPPDRQPPAEHRPGNDGGSGSM